MFVAIIAVLCAESLWASRQRFKRSETSNSSKNALESLAVGTNVNLFP